MLLDYPIKNGSRKEIVLYLCDLHNKVNQRLNKPIFDCQKAFDFWGGNCGCAADSQSQNKLQLVIPTSRRHVLIGSIVEKNAIFAPLQLMAPNYSMLLLFF